jgi:Uma2 family endonuclease
MSSESVIQEVHPLEEEWKPSMPPDDLIFDDGEPLETYRHRNAMNLLIRSIDNAWKDRNDYFTGGNMFIYYSRSQAKNRDFRGPDFFTVLDIDGSYARQGWVVWDEGGRYPDVIVELLSESTAAIDKGAKKTLYERVFRTSNYYVFNPFDANSLQGWQLDNQSKYQELTPNAQGWLWSDRLGLWLGTWQGEYEKESITWLRFYDPDGNLVLLPEEDAAQQVDAAIAQVERERQENERLRERLRAAGIDPDQP